MVNNHQTEHLHLDNQLYEALEKLASDNAAEREVGSLSLAQIAIEASRSVRQAQLLAETLKPAFIEAKSGLFRYHIFRQRVEYHLARPEEGSVAVLSYDLVKFKSINDNFGQQIGDLFIAEFGNALNNIVRHHEENRSNDIPTQLTDPQIQKYPARMGGDEFATLLVGIDDKTKLNLGVIAREKNHQLLNNKDLRNLIIKLGIDGFGVRSGATWLNPALSYTDNMNAADPKYRHNIGSESEPIMVPNLLSEAILQKTDHGYIIKDIVFDGR